MKYLALGGFIALVIGLALAAALDYLPLWATMTLGILAGLTFGTYWKDRQ